MENKDKPTREVHEMAYDIKNTKVIYLGRQGENLARTIEIDVSSMLMKWPDATISLLVKRNHEDTFYLAPVVIENGILKWTITNADTEIAGIGKIEVRAIQDDAIMKSATMKICVENSLGGTETDVPDPVQTWVDTIVAASVQAKQSAEDALASELAAKEAAESITGLESNIKTAEAARVEAEKERISAENERESAETSRETAENNRVAAETARVTAEQSRASAETARESAETDRQTTFETNESQRQTEFETAEAGRAAAESSRVAAEESRVSAEAGRVEAESERVAAENQRAETFAGYETRIDAATPDDSTVDGKPWTSRKIVDTLCPPFDVSGSAVTCHPVERYPLDVKVSLEPVQEGSGDPSPDNIRPIVGWDSVKVNRAGKNLLDFTSFTNYTNWRLDIAIEGNAPTNDTNKGYILPVKPSKTYTISFEFLGDTLPSYLYLVKSIHGVSERYKYITTDKIENKVVSFTPADNEIWYLRMGLTGIENTFNAQIENITYIQLEIGSTATVYEPYIGDTYTAELPETIYGGELDWNTGVLTVDRGITIADGTVNKFNPDATGKYWNMPMNSPPGMQNTQGVTNSHLNKGSFWLNGNYDFIYTTNIAMEGLFNTAEDLNAYLVEQNTAGTPVTFVYELKTPYTIQITPQQITALSGVNTLYTDSGDISVSGRTDMIWLTQSLIDRIAALETAAVSE